jgi:hypothetical protein
MTFPKTYARHSLKTLRAMLNERAMPPVLIENVLASVAEFKKTKRTKAQKQGQHARLWKDIIAPAKAERRIVQRMRTMQVKSDSPERADALDAYGLVLTVLIEKLEAQAATTTEMPRVIAAERRLHNKGEHWTDWVPSKQKERVQAYFDAVPYTRGVKSKQPFIRRIHKPQHEVLNARLIQRTAKELELVERRLAVALADTKLTATRVFAQQEIAAMRLQISKMQAAMHAARTLKTSELVPVTWHGLCLEEK